MTLDYATGTRPVLVAIYRAVDQGEPFAVLETDDVMAQLPGGTDRDEVNKILEHLRRTGYIEADMVGGGTWTVIQLLEPALQQVAGWPGAADDQTAERLIQLVTERMEQTTDPEEKTKLRKLRDGLVDVGKGVMTGVLTDLARGGF